MSWGEAGRVNGMRLGDIKIRPGSIELLTQRLNDARLRPSGAGVAEERARKRA